MAAKTVDLEHRLALCARQDPHRGIERTAGRRGAVIGVARRLQRHAPAAGLDKRRRPDARRVVSPTTPATLRPISSIGLRCTRSLKGSRTFSMRTIACAKDWMTETS